MQINLRALGLATDDSELASRYGVPNIGVERVGTACYKTGSSRVSLWCHITFLGRSDSDVLVIATVPD